MADNAPITLPISTISREFWSCTLIRDTVIDFLHHPHDDDTVVHSAILGLLTINKATFGTTISKVYKEVDEAGFTGAGGKKVSFFTYMEEKVPFADRLSLYAKQIRTVTFCSKEYMISSQQLGGLMFDFPQAQRFVCRKYYSTAPTKIAFVMVMNREPGSVHIANIELEISADFTLIDKQDWLNLFYNIQRVDEPGITVSRLTTQNRKGLTEERAGQHAQETDKQFLARIKWLMHEEGGPCLDFSELKSFSVPDVPIPNDDLEWMGETSPCIKSLTCSFDQRWDLERSKQTLQAIGSAFPKLESLRILPKADVVIAVGLEETMQLAMESCPKLQRLELPDNPSKPGLKPEEEYIERTFKWTTSTPLYPSLRSLGISYDSSHPRRSAFATAGMLLPLISQNCELPIVAAVEASGMGIYAEEVEKARRSALKNAITKSKGGEGIGSRKQGFRMLEKEK